MEYLDGFLSLKLTYRRSIGASRDLLSGFADSDWGNSSSRRSTSGNLMLYNKAPIMWKSKMQKTTAFVFGRPSRLPRYEVKGFVDVQCRN